MDDRADEASALRAIALCAASISDDIPEKTQSLEMS